MRARRRADAVRMALTPSLARLSLVARTGARASKAAKGERGAKEEKDLGWNGLPEDLWWSIVDAIDEPDACAQIEKMCAPTPEGEEDVDFPWSGWCKDGSLYERISARLGWYGDLPDWKAVEAHYQEGRAWDKRELARFNVFENAKAYFGHVCAERRKLRDAHDRRQRVSTYEWRAFWTTRTCASSIATAVGTIGTTHTSSRSQSTPSASKGWRWNTFPVP